MTDHPHTPERFEIIRMLGQGGMGTVYLARDQRLDRSVALKVLNPTDHLDQDRKSRFQREARAAASIRHQNVATIYEVGETDDGSPYLIMEYCEGETLAQRLRRRPVDSGEWLNIARQIAAGVAAAHDSGIVHRDIKTANIMIEPNGLVKILDFGLAKLLARDFSVTEKPSFESTSGHFFGTIHYLSPEQARGHHADERSDLFAIGVALYQMASGHLPFNADQPLGVLEKIRDAEPEPFVSVDPAFPPAATKIIAKLLQKDASLRYQNAHQLLEDLETIQTPTLRLSSTHTRSTLGRTLPRPRWVRGMVTAGLVLVVGSAIYLARTTAHPDSPRPAFTGSPQPIHSLAILPLDNLANNATDDFLSVGLADALVTKLQQIPSVQVRPTSAVLDFHNKKVDVRTAGEKLQVDGILEGHFLAAGDLVRVNLQLTDSRSGYSVWADSVDGKRDNLLKLIDDVSSKTLTGLNQRLGVKTQSSQHSEARSSNPQAYEEYLKSRALVGSFVPESYRSQIAHLKRAVELDPNFAAAFADLAIGMSLAQARSLTNEPDAMRQAESYARQAVRLDPNLPASHLALGRVFVRYPDRFPESVRENLAALRLDNNEVHALNTLATYLVSTGDLTRAQCVGERMIKLDPQSDDVRTRGYWNINAIDPEGALQIAQYALASKDSELAGRDIRAMAFILQGNMDAAEVEAKKASALAPKHYIGKSLNAMIAASRGDRATCELLIKSFEGDASRNHWAAMRVALCYAKLRDREKAIAWVKKSVDLGHHSWYGLVRHPWFVDFQSDPVFLESVTKVKADLDDVKDDVIGVFQLVCK